MRLDAEPALNYHGTGERDYLGKPIQPAPSRLTGHSKLR